MKTRSILLPLVLIFAMSAIAPAQPAPDADPQIPQILPPGAPVTPSLPPPRQRQAREENVSLTFPRNSVLDILNFYETLTGKRIIRDSNLAGNELSILIAKPVSREEAVAIIESSLLMNNYSIVPVDDQTVKILGPSRAPRTEGLPLYNNLGELPTDGDKVVSF